MFPDWYHPNASKYWNREFEDNFNPRTGVDIDGVWSADIGSSQTLAPLC